jgi:putative ABC transport system permease protein
VPGLLIYSLRSLWARRVRSVSTLLGIAFLVFVLCASFMLAAGIRETFVSSGRPDQALVLQHSQFSEEGSKLPASVRGQVAAAPGVRRGNDGQPLVTGEVVAHARMKSTRDPELVATLQVRGVADDVFRLRPDVHVVEGRALTPGTSEAMVGRGLLGRYEGLRLGDTFELAAGRPIAVVGVLESRGSLYESEVWVDLSTAQRSLDLEATLSSVTAELEGANAFDAFAATLGADKVTGLQIVRTSGYFERASFGLRRLVLVLGSILGALFSLGAVMGAMLTLHASVAQRAPEIGVLRALGFGWRAILAVFLLESLSIALAGAALGVAFSLLTPLFDFGTTNPATSQQVGFHFQPHPSVLVIALAVALVVGLLGGALPSIRAARLDPVTALRGGVE